MSLTPARLAAAIFCLAAATIVAAWIFQAMGYAPCELCLKERLPYYAGIAVAAAALWLAATGRTALAAACFAALALIFAFGAAFGIYHSGVEWGLWKGPTDCAGALDRAGSIEDFRRQLETVKVVRCDAVSLRVFGLSLAVWNAVISAGLTVLAGLGFQASREGAAMRTPSGSR